MIPILALDDEGVLMIIAMGLGVAVIGIISGTLKHIFTVRAREASRREIAAYIAEGSMTPEEGERLMRARPGERI
ncbi:MAG: hypothetical protein AB7G17_05940 [Phycisphaerales bacterium]